MFLFISVRKRTFFYFIEDVANTKKAYHRQNLQNYFKDENEHVYLEIVYVK